MYVMRLAPDIENLFQPLEDVMRHHFLPAITGRSASNGEERDLLALPVRLGGLGILHIASNAHRVSYHK